MQIDFLGNQLAIGMGQGNFNDIGDGRRVSGGEERQKFSAQTKRQKINPWSCHLENFNPTHEKKYKQSTS